jgi:hypothetical protein
MLPARANPFRADRIEALRYRLDEASWRALLDRFVAHERRGVLVGPHGSGKTTLREEIERRLRADGFTVRSLVLGDDRRVAWSDLRTLVADADAQTVISLDGIDRMSSLLWWRFRRSTTTIGGILATSHVCGRLPVLHHHETSADLVRSLIQELTDAATATTLHSRCAVLFERHRGDVRACLRSLYDEFADHADGRFAEHG